MVYVERLRRGDIFGMMMGLALSTGTALAEQCTFTTECFEAEACSDTSFSLTIEGGALITDAETIPVSSGGSDATTVYVGYTPSAFHILTREKGARARYSTHIFDGLMMVNYMGTCE